TWTRSTAPRKGWLTGPSNRPASRLRHGARRIHDRSVTGSRRARTAARASTSAPPSSAARLSTTSRSATSSRGSPGAGRLAGSHTTRGTSGRAKGPTMESRWKRAGPRTSRRTSSKHTARPSDSRAWTQRAASTPVPPLAAGWPGSPFSSITTRVRDGWRTPRSWMMPRTRSASAWLLVTATSVSTLARTAARCSWRRRPDSARSTSPMETSSASHVPRVTGVTWVTGGYGSWTAPAPAVAAEEVVGLFRAPRAGLVAGQGDVALLERLQHRVDDTPGLGHLVGADEQRLVAEEGVEQQPLVGLRRLLQEGGAVEEVHGDRPHPERLPRHLGAEAEGDPLVGLHPQDEGVGVETLGLVGGEGQMGDPVELHGHLRHPLGEVLAGADIDRDPRPAPVVDPQAHGDVGLGGGVGVDPLLLPVALDLLALDPALAVLAPDHVEGHLLGGEDVDRPQRLDLLVPDAVGVERGGRLHEGEGQHLHDVVLDDVAQGPRPLVEAAPVPHPERLGHRDLHVVDVAPVPQGLEDGVGEAQGEDVLDRLLPQVVADAVHLPLLERLVHDAVELGRRRPVP